MLIVSDLLAGVLAAVFLAAAVPKLIGVGPLPAEFVRFGYSRDLLIGTGCAEALGSLLLVAGIATVGPARVVGSCVLIVVMAGALVTHRRVGDPPTKVAPPLILAVVIAVELVAYAVS